jgi:hypothetical protein
LGWWERMSADDNVIHLGDRVEFVSTVSDLDNMQRTINSAREMLKMFKPHDRASLLGQVAASEFCSYGEPYACRGLALRELGVFVAEVCREIDKVFPPSCEEGFR